MSDEDLDLKDDLFADDSDSAGDSGSDNSAPPKDAATEKPEDKKRVYDLMSKWQASEARANALQAKLDAKGGGPAEGSKDGDTAGGDSESAAEFVEYAREDARRRIFESDPSFAAAGLDQSAITGSTLSEMKASAARQKTLIDAMQSRLRGQILQEHGLDPEVVAGGHEEAPKIAGMSDDEFAALLEKRDASKYA